MGENDTENTMDETENDNTIYLVCIGGKVYNATDSKKGNKAGFVFWDEEGSYVRDGSGNLQFSPIAYELCKPSGDLRAVELDTKGYITQVRDPTKRGIPREVDTHASDILSTANMPSQALRVMSSPVQPSEDDPYDGLIIDDEDEVPSEHKVDFDDVSPGDYYARAGDISSACWVNNGRMLIRDTQEDITGKAEVFHGMAANAPRYKVGNHSVWPVELQEAMLTDMSRPDTDEDILDSVDDEDSEFDDFAQGIQVAQDLVDPTEDLLDDPEEQEEEPNQQGSVIMFWRGDEQLEATLEQGHSGHRFLEYGGRALGRIPFLFYKNRDDPAPEVSQLSNINYPEAMPRTTGRLLVWNVTRRKFMRLSVAGLKSDHSTRVHAVKKAFFIDKNAKMQEAASHYHTGQDRLLLLDNIDSPPYPSAKVRFARKALKLLAILIILAGGYLIRESGLLVKYHPEGFSPPTPSVPEDHGLELAKAIAERDKALIQVEQMATALAATKRAKLPTLEIAEGEKAQLAIDPRKAGNTLTFRVPLETNTQEWNFANQKVTPSVNNIEWRPAGHFDLKGLPGVFIKVVVRGDPDSPNLVYHAVVSEEYKKGGVFFSPIDAASPMSRLLKQDPNGQLRKWE